MKSPPIPEDESARLQELLSYSVLDTAAERAYDALVRIASQVTGRPIALISLIDRDRQWFKARVGLDAEQTGREESFCAHMVDTPEPLVVRNALDDVRFHDNPLVVGEPDIRFYAGAPLISPNQHVLGSLCVIDTEPGDIGEAELLVLELLAEQAVMLLEMRRIGAQLDRERREARAFFDASLDFQCVASFDGYFIELNNIWSEVLGFDRETLKSRPFIEFVHPADQADVMAEIAALRESGELHEFSVRFQTATGEARWLQFNATSDEQSQRYIAAARDITKSKRRSEALAKARDAAEQASRAKSVFLANMSHELRTPLNSVIGFANVLLKNRDGNLAEKQLDYLGRIHKNGRHLLELLNDILDVSKIEVGQLEILREEVDLEALLEDVLKAMRDGERLELDVPSETQATLVGDELRLRQVITNLVGNALKFSDEERPVVVRLSSSVDQPLQLHVIDQGIGIEPDALERIFEPFEQAESGTDRRFGGTGLGLAIARSLCDSMGFSLTATSEPGHGSTFTITFDRQASPAREEAHGQSPTRRPKLTPSRRGPVLIVDDSPESRLLLETAVADLGYPVVACDAPQLALPLAKALRPHAVLLDLMMPDINGFDVLKSFEAHPTLKDVPILIVSIVGLENRSLLTHAVEVLPKPTQKDALARALDGVGNSQRRVLLVDDDPDARQLVIELMHELEVDVDECSNGAEALERLADTTYDAVVLDLTMPVLDGVQFLHLFRKDPRFTDIPVVVFSALGGAPARLNEQVSAIVQKDGDLDTLRTALKHVL